jgi:flavin reductase (DIM6/NTAB) family NADH-FMN oxidoreductase RutF
MKIERKPSAALLPTPVVLLSVAGHGKEKPNIITLAWAGTVCSTPPMLSVAIRPTRHSHRLVNAAREFVVNVPRAEQLEQVDLAGVWSGAEHDKFEELGLTARPASAVNAPLIEECPIVAVQYDEDVLDAQGRVQTRKLTPIAYVEGEYWSLGERIGSYGAAAKASGRR